MYPKLFIPTDIELFVIHDKPIEIPKCIVNFEKWTGNPIKETFGGKPIFLLIISQCLQNWQSWLASSNMVGKPVGLKLMEKVRKNQFV